MEVTLIKKAKYDLVEEKYTQIPFDMFLNLTEPKLSDNDTEGDDIETADDVVVFADKNEFRQEYRHSDIDETRPVYVNKQNQIFCFLRKDSKKDASADSK